MINAIPLTHRRVLRFTGEDVANFLNGQTTVSATLFNTPSPIAHYGAFLRPQGKVISDAIFVVMETGHVLCHIAAECFDEMLQRLSMVRLRARVTIEAPALNVYIHLGSAPIDPKHFVDSRHAILKSKTVFSWSFDSKSYENSPSPWTSFRYENGLGEFGCELKADQVYANEVNLDLLGGIDFHKGCYVGQELTSRMKRRDAIKNRLIPVLIDPFQPLTNPDEPPEILCDDQRAGRLLGSRASHSNCLGLALLRLDRLGAPLHLADHSPVRPEPATWLLPHIRISSDDE